MSGVKFGNAKKVWQFFPSNLASVTDAPKAAPKIKMSRNSCAMLIAFSDIAGQRLLHRVVASGEAPVDPITSFANELLAIMRDHSRDPKSFRIEQSHAGDHIGVDCSIRNPTTGEYTGCSSTLLDLEDATAMIATGLCCLSRVYGRKVIEPFVGSGSIHMFPCETDLVSLGDEGADPYDLFQDFGEVLLFDDQNMDAKNKAWLFDSFAVVDHPVERKDTEGLRKDRD